MGLSIMVRFLLYKKFLINHTFVLNIIKKFKYIFLSWIRIEIIEFYSLINPYFMKKILWQCIWYESFIVAFEFVAHYKYFQVRLKI